MQENLFDKLQVVARTPRLLVGCDYDGTLAELVETPALAFPSMPAVRALCALGQASCTSTAVVSGRAYRVLLGFLGKESPHALVGSHGAEWRQPGVDLDASQRELLERIESILTSVARLGPGVHLERKPAGAALHVRGATRQVTQAAIIAAMERCGGLPGVRVRPGVEVVEFAVIGTDKGDAVRRLRHHAGATGVIFIGDDLTDEDAFKALTDTDLAVRVGQGETVAQFRVANVQGVADLLHALGTMRHRWALAQTGGSP